MSEHSETRRILVIEDEPAMLDLLITLLRREGYDVFGCLDGRRGIRAALERAPDLVILDLFLGDMGGEQVFRALKDHAPTARVPVVFCTVQGPGTLKRKVNEIPAHVLYKPFTVQSLRKIVFSALR